MALMLNRLLPLLLCLGLVSCRWLAGPTRIVPLQALVTTLTPTVSPTASPTASPPGTPGPSPTITPTYSPSPTPTVSPTPQTLWQDFESNIIFGLWDCEGPTPMTTSWSADFAVSGTHSWKMETGEGTDYGHWTGLGDKRKDVDLIGAKTLKFWIKCSVTLTTEMYWDEGLSSGADGETWGRRITIPGGPDWQELVFPLSTFNSYGGNNIQDTQAINSIWFYHVVPYAAHTLYIDDIRFTP